jgi:hypothetical protein
MKQIDNNLLKLEECWNSHLRGTLIISADQLFERCLMMVDGLTGTELEQARSYFKQNRDLGGISGTSKHKINSH